MRVIAGTYRSRILKSIKGFALRPTSDRLRETLFNVLAPNIAGSRFVDLFAGTGAIGIEALSRGAAEVVFIENHALAVTLIRRNLESLGISTGATVLAVDALRGLAMLAARKNSGALAFDHIFLDPPYAAAEDYSRVLEFLGAADLLASGGIVIAEHRRNFDLLEERGALTRFRVLKQGDAALSFYRRRGVQGVETSGEDNSAKTTRRSKPPPAGFHLSWSVRSPFAGMEPGYCGRGTIELKMSWDQVNVASNLLGQAAKPDASQVCLETGRGPKLDVAWGSFHQGIFSSIAAILTWTRVPKNFLDDSFFKECWVERKIPRRALIAAALWHVVFIVMPSLHLPAAPTHFSAFDNTELTWSGPITDFPLVDLKTPRAKPTPRGEPDKSLPPAGADAFHPRQRIFTDPAHPTHPRQTLINSGAPLDPPKILPTLPNIVQFQQLPGPARPRLQISREALSKLRPRELLRVKMTTAPAPDLPTLDQKLADIAPSMLPNAPARPKLELNTGAAPRVAQRTQTSAVEPAPEVSSAQSGIANGNAATFIALSATPGPPAPVVPPQGNLAARVSISPEGTQPGVPGGSPNGTPGANSGSGPASSGGAAGGNSAAKNGMDISISGGHPSGGSAISGPGGSPRAIAPPARALIAKPDPHAKPDDAPERTGPPNFTALPPGAQPEQIFASKKIYRMLVNMPNLNSATGSWILNFSELSTGSAGPQAESSEVSAPGPLRKIDPKYPPTLINEHVEGEVVLYAVIRRDGSVDSIQLVLGVDDQLDANAMNALSQWKFRPATKQGTPIELEAIVHIPFHAPPDR